VSALPASQCLDKYHDSAADSPGHPQHVRIDDRRNLAESSCLDPVTSDRPDEETSQ
jgi:hypothetical protein